MQVIGRGREDWSAVPVVFCAPWAAWEVHTNKWLAPRRSRSGGSSHRRRYGHVDHFRVAENPPGVCRGRDVLSGNGFRPQLQFLPAIHAKSLPGLQNDRYKSNVVSLFRKTGLSSP